MTDAKVEAKPGWTLVAVYYSRHLGNWLWVVRQYPSGVGEEQTYHHVKKSLSLKRQGAWRIWPGPFVPPDGRACYYVGSRQRDERLRA